MIDFIGLCLLGLILFVIFAICYFKYLDKINI